MNERFLEYSEGENQKSIFPVNRILGLEWPGFFPFEKRPSAIEISGLWVIVKDHVLKHKLDKEMFLGIDSIGEKLEITEETEGNHCGVRPKEYHLLGAHLHPEKSPSPSLRRRILSLICPSIKEIKAPFISPSEVLEFRADPKLYAELIITNSRSRIFSVCLMIKTAECTVQRFCETDEIEQEFRLREIVGHTPRRKMLAELFKATDNFAKEIFFAIYRGSISEGFLGEQFLARG